jgi:hypothetical protein
MDLDPIALGFGVALRCTHRGTAPCTLGSAVGQCRQATILVSHHVPGHSVRGQLGIMVGQPGVAQLARVPISDQDLQLGCCIE